ncbi:MAG: GntR family transcriptional regulator [Acidimicrobiales bacterium]
MPIDDRHLRDVAVKAQLRTKVAERLTTLIESGEWRPGTRVPNETVLATELGVSRPTLREGLRSLEEEGYLRRTRGSGTFVTYRPRLKNTLDINFGVSELIRSVGMVPGTEGLTVYPSTPTELEAQLLGLSPGTEVMVIDRIRTANGQPVVHSRDLLPAHLLADAGTDALSSLAQRSLYEVLADIDINVVQGVASVMPERAQRRIATLLRVPRETLLIYIRQVDYDQHGRPVLLSYEYHVASAFEVTVHRRGPMAK